MGVAGFPSTLSAMMGTVVAAYQGLHTYQVVTDFGRYICSYGGAGTGVAGVQHAGGIQAGTYVFILAQPGLGFGAIVGIVDPAWAITTASPNGLVTSPQVSGFQLDTRLVGSLLQQGTIALSSYPSDVGVDLCNGEVGLLAQHGSGGIAVEQFRSWLRGGPMSGITCFHDTNLTRIQALDFEYISLIHQDYERRHGNSMVESKTRVFYPSEAFQDLLPRHHTIAGPIHGGSHEFRTIQAARGTARPALFHQHIADDGSYSLTSASGVYLQRYAGIVVPEESQAVETTAAPQLVPEQPLDADPLRQTVLTNPRPFVTTASTDPYGVTYAQHLYDVTSGIEQIRGFGGFNRLPVQWPSAGQPAGVPNDLLHTSYNTSMWRNLPRSFSLTIDPIVGPKTFYVGRSFVALMPDGSVVIEDAYHSQVTMSGGNIMMAAPHDIVISAGRNITMISGSCTAIRANDNVDVCANTGAVLIKADQQLSMMGGNDGQAGGVLIESKSVATVSVPGTGAVQQINGILLKSASGTFVTGAEVGIVSTAEPILLESANAIYLKSQQIEMQVPKGLVIAHDTQGTSPGHTFTTNGMTTTGIVCQGDLDALGTAFIAQSIEAGNQIVAPGYVGTAKLTNVNQTIASITAVFTNLSDQIRFAETGYAVYFNQATPLNQKTLDRLGFSFWTSTQLGTNSTRAWWLPEASWQAMSRIGGFGTAYPWVEKPVLSVAGDNMSTSAFPGYEVWVSGTQSYQLQTNGLYVDLTTGAVALPSDPTQATLVAGQFVAANLNFLTGDPNG
jgi:hypothetical protein